MKNPELDCKLCGGGGIQVGNSAKPGVLFFHGLVYTTECRIRLCKCVTSHSEFGPKDVTNPWLIGRAGERIVMMRPPRGEMTKDDALLMAAWIVAIVGDKERFETLLSAVENT